MSTLVGPALAAMLLAAADPATALAAAAVLTLAAGLALIGLSYDAPPAAPAAPTRHRSAKPSTASAKCDTTATSSCSCG